MVSHIWVNMVSHIYLYLEFTMKMKPSVKGVGLLGGGGEG